MSVLGDAVLALSLALAVVSSGDWPVVVCMSGGTSVVVGEVVDGSVEVVDGSVEVVSGCVEVVGGSVGG